MDNKNKQPVGCDAQLAAQLVYLVYKQGYQQMQ